MQSTIIKTLFFIIFVEILITGIFGILYIIEQTILELFNYDIFEGIKKRMEDKDGNK